MTRPSRLLFLWFAITAVTLPLAAQTANASLTVAAAAIRKIIAATGATPSPNTVDTIKGGDANAIVIGIATTFLDTYQVLGKAGC
jgi:hypothetical protein